jgi:hypothetical protein
VGLSEKRGDTVARDNKTQQSPGEQFRSRLNSLSNSFELLTQILNRADWELSAFVLDRLLQSLDRLQGAIRKAAPANAAFLAALNETRMPKFDEDRKLAADYARRLEGDESVPSRDIMNLANRVEDYLDAMKGGLSFLYPDGSLSQKFDVFLRAQRKRIYGIAAGVLVLGLGFYLLRWNENLKYSLHREMFSDQGLAHSYSKSLDATVNFDWGYGPPKLGFKVDDFSIRWTGFLSADLSGDYEFVTESDDGIRLWINDKLLIDDWNSHSMQRQSGKIILEPGCHAIRLEYFENNAAAGVKLLWKTPALKELEAVPSLAFRSEKTYCR